MRTLVLITVLGVLAPTGAVLWFMNEAARSQADAARQSVNEAYRGQLRLLRDRIDRFWTERAAGIEAAGDFAAVVRSGGADAAVLLDGAGAVISPQAAASVAADPLADREDWIGAQMIESRRGHMVEAAAAYARIGAADTNPSVAARAAQAQIRCLLTAGRRDDALAAIERWFSSGRMARGHDPMGRWIAADEQLLALKLRRRGDARRETNLRLLVSWLGDYALPLPSAQRLFLIGELRALEPGLPEFPYAAAERMALEYLQTERPRPGASGSVEPAGVPGLWKLTSPNQRVMALYRTETIQKEAAGALTPAKGVRFAVTPAGAAGATDAIPAGRAMPGWEISFTLVDTQAFDDATRRRRATYLWVGYAVAAALALGGLAAGRFFGRQMKLARLKTDLVAAVSHELKTPLASMRLLVDTLLEEETPDPPKTREYLELIAGENLRLTRLIENFLTFSRIERNRQRFEFAPTQPARIVDAALAAMRERLRAPGCAFEVEIGDGLPRIAADEDALVTVLLNLLDNACKYTPKEKRIALRASGDAGGVVFAVEDNGIGIPPREQKRIFRRFYQVDRRLARETGGCGLGLSIVDFIVRAHGGRVEVTSAAGAGSTFRVWLPGCGPAAREASA